MIRQGDCRSTKSQLLAERILGQGSGNIEGTGFGGSRSKSEGNIGRGSAQVVQTTPPANVLQCNKKRKSVGFGPRPRFRHSSNEDISRKSRCQSSPRQSPRTSLSNVTPIWKHLGPNPDIQQLFLEYDQKFFAGVLAFHQVTVEWSKRLKSTVGSCSGGYPPKIRLSEALLKLRPVRDLVETLLHEMIHAYLCVSEDEFEREEHGPNFHKHMKRIDQLAGTYLTVDHPFHKEVKMNQYEWQCDGKCRAVVNHCYYKPPGPLDSWWKEHTVNCGGRFILKDTPLSMKKVLETAAPGATTTAATTATASAAAATATAARTTPPASFAAASSRRSAEGGICTSAVTTRGYAATGRPSAASSPKTKVYPQQPGHPFPTFPVPSSRVNSCLLGGSPPSRTGAKNFTTYVNASAGAAAARDSVLDGRRKHTKSISRAPLANVRSRFPRFYNLN